MEKLRLSRTANKFPPERVDREVEALDSRERVDQRRNYAKGVVVLEVESQIAILTTWRLVKPPAVGQAYKSLANNSGMSTRNRTRNRN